MASRISIANLALTGLGADRIVSLNEDSENARRINAIFDLCLEDVLRSHPWNFAIQRQQLAKLLSVPAFGYSLEYLLPGDCLRVLEVNDGSCIRTDFKIENRKLLTDYDGVYIKFIGNVTDPTQYTSQFVYVLSSRIAAELAYAITNNKSTAEMAYQLYAQRLQTAKEADAQESDSTYVIDEDSWTIDKRS
jgi:hypothetical protein